MPTATADTLQPLLPLLTRTLGHRPSPATVWRWCNHGLKAGEDRVKLRALRIGAKLYATPDDVQAFIEAQNPPEDIAAENAVGERDEATKRRLEKAGLLEAGPA